MSDDGCDFPDPETPKPTMEIVVESLTGTAFQMTVFTDDNVFSIKKKIERVEGVPISEQHLLFHLKELNNEDRLSDLRVTSGSTLQLVTSMKGGPMATSWRLPNPSWRLPNPEWLRCLNRERRSNFPSDITIMLLPDGEVSVIKITENEKRPMPESPKENIMTEISQTRFKERTNENSVMLHKVIELRRKMESLSMQRKAKKPIEYKNNDNIQYKPLNNQMEPPTFDLGVENGTSFFSEQLPRKVDNDPFKMSTNEYAIPTRQRTKQTNLGFNQRRHLESSLSKVENQSRSYDAGVQTQNIAIIEDPKSKVSQNNSNFNSISPISVVSNDSNTITMSQIPNLPGPSRSLFHLTHIPQVMVEDRPKRAPEKFDSNAQNFCNFIFNDSTKVGINQTQSMEFATNKGSQFLNNSTSSEDSVNSNTEPVPNYDFRGRCGKIPVYGRRTRYERMRSCLNSPEKCSFPASVDKPGSDLLPDMQPSLNFQYDSSMKQASDSEFKCFKVAKRRCKTQPMNCFAEATVPQFPPITPVKKTKIRCAFCNKRLNVITMHTCRCEGIFCSQHRYSEVHKCHYDYKAEGRKIIEDNLDARKFPKI